MRNRKPGLRAVLLIAVLALKRAENRIERLYIAMNVAENAVSHAKTAP